MLRCHPAEPSGPTAASTCPGLAELAQPSTGWLLPPCPANAFQFDALMSVPFACNREIIWSSVAATARPRHVIEATAAAPTPHLAVRARNSRLPKRVGTALPPLKRNPENFDQVDVVNCKLLALSQSPPGYPKNPPVSGA